MQHQFSVQELAARGGGCAEPCRQALLLGSWESLKPELPVVVGIGGILLTLDLLKNLSFQRDWEWFREGIWKLVPKIREWLGIVLIPFVVLGAGASTVLYRDRYLLPFVLPLSVLLPLGIARTLLIFQISPQFRGFITLLLSLLSVTFLWPERREVEGLSHHGASAWRWLQNHPEGRWMDCAGLGLETLALPHPPHAGPLNLAGISIPLCTQWITTPEAAGPVYLITSEHLNINHLRPAYEGWIEQAVFNEPTIPTEPTIILWSRRPNR